MLDHRLLFAQRLGEHDLRVLSALSDVPIETDELRRRLQRQPGEIELLLTDDRLFDVLFAAEANEEIEVLSPSLAFAVLVYRSVRDLKMASYVREWVGAGERLPVFDVSSLRSFIDDVTRRFLLIDLLASFTRVASGATWVRTSRGYRRRRYSELDPASLADHVGSLPMERRPAGYRRLGDLALFLTGVFPDHTARNPMSAMRRARLASSTGIDGGWDLSVEYVQFLEIAGTRWYDRAANGASCYGESRESLQDLAANFIEARRFLNYLADSHLHRFDTGLMNPVG